MQPRKSGSARGTRGRRKKTAGRTRTARKAGASRARAKANGQEGPLADGAAGPQIPAMQLQALEAAAEGQVRQIMTREAVTVRPDTSVEAVMQLLLDRQISGVPVVDEDGAPVGIVSKTDLVREQFLRGDSGEEGGEGGVQVPFRRGVRYSPGQGYHVHQEDRRTAAEVMTPIALTVRDDAPISEAARRMAAGGIHRMPVVSPEGRVVGIISAMDIVGWVAGLLN